MTVLQPVFAGVGAADAGLHVLNVDRALAADGLDQRFAGNLAAEFVIGGNEGQRELDRAIDVVAIADEGIDGDDRQSGVIRLLQRRDHAFLIHRGGEQVLQIATGHHRVEHRRLIGDVPIRRNLGNQFYAKPIGRLLRTALHGEVERILHTGQEADLHALRGVLRFGHVGSVEELLYRRVIHVVFGDDLIASGNVRRDAGGAIKISHRHFGRQIAHVRRLLRDDHVDRAALQHLNGGLGRIEGHDLNLAAEALVLHDLPCTLRAEDVGAEDTAQIGFLLQHGFHLRLGLGRIVIIVVHGYQRSHRDWLR